MESPTKFFWNQTKKNIISNFKPKTYKCHKDLKTIEVKLDGYCPELNETLKPVKGEIEKFIDIKELIYNENRALVEKCFYKSMDNNMEIIKESIFNLVEKNGASLLITLKKGYYTHEKSDYSYLSWQHSKPLTRSFFYLYKKLRRNKLKMSKFLKFFKVAFNKPVRFWGPIEDRQYGPTEDGEFDQHFKLCIGKGRVKIIDK